MPAYQYVYVMKNLTKAYPGGREVFKGITLSFFPDAKIVLDWVREEGGGNVYRWAEKDMEGWLCPALFKYFEQTPQKLYVQVKAAG